MDKPIHFKEVLSPILFASIKDDLIDSWVLSNESYKGDSITWGLMCTHDKMSFLQASAIIKLKICKHIKEKIQLVKIHANGQTSNQKAAFHADFAHKNVWSFILFTEWNWNTQWGGEFIAQHPKTREYHYTPYIPNSGVLIPSHWQHYGASPNAYTDRLRTTLAFSYAELNTVDDILEEQSHLPLHRRRALRFM